MAENKKIRTPTNFRRQAAGARGLKAALSEGQAEARKVWGGGPKTGQAGVYSAKFRSGSRSMPTADSGRAWLATVWAQIGFFGAPWTVRCRQTWLGSRPSP